MLAQFTPRFVRTLFVLAGIAGGVVVNQVSPLAALWFIGGCTVGWVGSEVWQRLSGWRSAAIALLSISLLCGCWLKAWVEYDKPEQPNIDAVFVPEPGAGTRMSAHITLENHGRDDWEIVLKRYALPDDTPLATDFGHQTIFAGRKERVNIPYSPDFVEHVIKVNGRFNFQISLVPLRSPQTKPLVSSYPFEFPDNALAATVEPTTSVPPQRAVDARVRSADDLSRALSAESGDAVWRLPERNADGSENHGCFPIPHHGAVVYWPAHHLFAFTLTQGGLRKTMVAKFKPAAEHEVALSWDQTGSWMSLSVDRIPAQTRGAVDGRIPWQLSCPV